MGGGGGGQCIGRNNFIIYGTPYGDMEVRSLKDLSYATVISYVLIGDYSMSELLRLPTVPRYQLFDTLTVLEIWRLETGKGKGLDTQCDTDILWEGRMGLDQDTARSEGNPPQLKIAFSKSEACFQFVWNTLDHMISMRETKYVKPLMQVLFSNKTDDSYIKRIPTALKLDFIHLYVRAKRESESDRYQAAKVACDCAKHVLTLVLNSGYRPSYISYNSLMAYLDGNEDALLEKLLCSITAVATPSAEMTKKWFHLVLNNSMPALKLGVRGDFPPNMYIFVQRTAEKKKLEVVNL